MKIKKIALILLVVFLCSTFAAAGFFDSVTGKFSFSRIFGIKKAEPIAMPQIICGNGICETGESEATCPEDCIGDCNCEELFVGKINGKADDKAIDVRGQLDVDVSSAAYATHAIHAVAGGGAVPIKGENLGGAHGSLGDGDYGVKGYASAALASTGVYGESRAPDGRGVWGQHGITSPNYGYLGSERYGVYGENQYSESYGYLGSAKYGAYGKHSNSGSYGYLGSEDYGAYGEDPNSGSYGYLGSASSGVYGYSPVLEFYGVKGEHSRGNYGYLGSGNMGVYGKATGAGYSVKGEHTTGDYGYLGAAGIGAAGFSGTGWGVYAWTFSGNALRAQVANNAGYAAVFQGGKGVQIVGAGAGLCIDTDNGCIPEPGKGYAKNGFFTGAKDVAEAIPSNEELEPGDVTIIDSSEEIKVRRSVKAYDSLVAGIVSTEPGFGLGDEGEMIALAGRVPTKVSAENGPIEIGDLLTTSNTPGHAMKCTDMQKCALSLIGRALEPLPSGTGKIIVLVD